MQLRVDKDVGADEPLAVSLLPASCGRAERINATLQSRASRNTGIELVAHLRTTQR